MKFDPQHRGRDDDSQVPVFLEIFVQRQFRADVHGNPDRASSLGRLEWRDIMTAASGYDVGRLGTARPGTGIALVVVSMTRQHGVRVATRLLERVVEILQHPGLAPCLDPPVNGG